MLCIDDGDPGPLSGQSDEDRLDYLIHAFETTFLQPWITGELDIDFEKESENYWSLWVGRTLSQYNPITQIYITNERATVSQVYSAKLLVTNRTVFVGEESLTNRYIQSTSNHQQQIEQVIVAEIPIAHELTPLTWPRNQTDVEEILSYRLSATQTQQFHPHQWRKKRHRIVLMRSPRCSYGFLMPGGPIRMVGTKRKMREQLVLRMLPLSVERLDPHWTYGRDQHNEVSLRQQSHVVVFGAGALGSLVIDQLARAGVGHITIVDPDFFKAANIGRHLLGAESLNDRKANAVATRIGLAHPACQLDPQPIKANVWLQRYDLDSVNVVLDLTGEPEVRALLEIARQQNPCPLLIGWMEPYVAAAHACLLTKHNRWMRTIIDPLEELQSVTWPPDVIQREPGCSSRFQSYTAAAAMHAVALVSESALALIDGKISTSVQRSWIRGQRFLDAHYAGLIHRDWASEAAAHDGIIIERSWYE